MTCGGDGKATWMCNFLVKLSETYRVTWREGGSPHTGLLLTFGSMPLLTDKRRCGQKQLTTAPPPHPFPHLSPLVTPLPRIIANNPFFVTTLALFACQKLSFLFA